MLKNDLLADFSHQVEHLCRGSLLASHDFHIALSGGLDSVVLLHLFTRLREKTETLTLSAHHINHGLSANALSWSDFCAQLCQDLRVDFSCSCLRLQKKTRTSLEALAREKRYACLTQNLSENSYLVSAHHQDDQLETVLLALKRGAGNTGLQGIRSKQPLHKGYLIRPLLNFSRLQLEAYAQSFALQWIEDESNSDQHFDRNYIRHSISPLLKARWPAIAKTVARSASICQEQQQLLDEIAHLDFSRCVGHLLNHSMVAIKELKTLSVARRNNVLRYWFKQNNLNYPSLKQLLAVWDNMVLAAQSASPLIQFKDVTLRRYRDHLYLVADQAVIEPSNVLIWQGEPQLSLLQGRVKLNFQLATEPNQGGAITANAKVEVCFRTHFSAKLSCTPVGRNGSRSVKKLLHEYHVPPWLRDSVPFIFIDGQLHQAVGLWQCQLAATDKPKHYLSVSFD